MQDMCAAFSDRYQLYVLILRKSTGLTWSLDLSGAVDVYSDWIDACDSVAKETAGHASAHAVSRARRDSLDEDLDDDFIEMDDADAEGVYAD